MSFAMILADLASEGKYRELGRHYSWEPQFSDPQKAIEYYLENSVKFSLTELAFGIPSELMKIESISPVLKEKLLQHMQSMLNHLMVSENIYEIEVLVNTLGFYVREMRFNPKIDIANLAHGRRIFIGKKFLKKLADYCEIYPHESTQEKTSILITIDDVIKSGVALESLGVASNEEMLNLANCKM